MIYFACVLYLSRIKKNYTYSKIKITTPDIALVCVYSYVCCSGGDDRFLSIPVAVKFVNGFLHGIILY